MEVRKIENFDIVIKPQDSQIRALSNLETDWDLPAYEIINNAIQAALDRGIDLAVDIKFIFNENGDINELHIRDESGGISMDDISDCLTPAKRPAVKTLNEHGMGLNIAIEKLTQHEKCTYVLRSCHKDGSFEINQRPSFEGMTAIGSLPRTDGTYGLSFSFYGLDKFMTLKFPYRHNRGDVMNFWANMCAKYRNMHKKFTTNNKSFAIRMELEHPVHDSKVREFKPVYPQIINPSNGNKDEWVCEFTLQDADEDGNEYEVRYRLGVANDEAKAYEIDIGESTLTSQTHPYRYGSSDAAGFDVIYHDTVIQKSDFEVTGIQLIGSTRTSYIDLRGEIEFLRGGSSYFTKNGINSNPTIDGLHAKAMRIFKGKEKHPSGNLPLTNFIKTYIERKSSVGTYPSEKIIKHRHSVAYKEMHERELQSEANTYVGRMDMVDPGVVIYEHKAQKSKYSDVAQLYAYLRYNDNIPKGVLYAPEHSDEAKDYAEKLNADLVSLNRSQVIELKTTPQSWLNTSLTEQEKNL